MDQEYSTSGCKQCSRCKLEKPKSEFYKEKRSKDGLASRCKQCNVAAVKEWYHSDPVNKKKAKIRAVLWNRLHPENGQNARLRRRYGLDLEQHRRMYQGQDGCCLLCRHPVPYSEIHTDHDHTTGKVRGLLCRECNYLIGKLEAYPHLLYDAFKYLGW